VVGIVDGVGHDDLGPVGIEKGCGLRRVTAMSGGENDLGGITEAPHGKVDFGAQAAARATKGLILSPFFALAAC
jgi:hypothetical protein